MSQQPFHHYLPALDAQVANVPMPATSAHWSAQPSGLLQAIGNGISVDGSAVTRGVSSVPDVWARAVLFQTALLHPKHPLHDEAVKDWRGLLSLLALREIYGYSVEIVPVSLAGSGQLEKALRTLAPTPIELEEGTPYAWTDVLLIRLDGVPVGAFSPGSLVYTATGYKKRLRKHFEPDGGVSLQPPPILGPDYALVAPTKQSDEFTAHYVAEYVYRLYKTYSGLLGKAPVAQRISELLDEWLSELKAAFGIRPHDPVDAPEVTLAPGLPVGSAVAGWPHLNIYSLYRHALIPLAEDSGPPPPPGTPPVHKSTIFLRHRRNHSAYLGVVVAHKDTLTEDAKVWGLRQPRSLGATVEERLATYFNAPQGDRLGDVKLAQHYACWIRPERYFLTDVLLAPREGVHILAVNERSTNAEGRYLLPFRREILDFFGPEDIQNVLQPRFEELRDGSIRFMFKLPVGRHPDLDSSGDGRAGGAPTAGVNDPFAGIGAVQAQSDPTIMVERIYRPKRDSAVADGAGTLHQLDLPILDLFPNYLGPSWRRYYLFQSDADTFDCRPYAHGATVETRQGDAYTEEQDGLQRKARVTEICGDDPFPDGIEVRAANGTPVGLVLTKRPLWDIRGVAGRWVVGIDFGTSNTNVARQQGNSPVEGWTIDLPAYLRPLAADPRNQRDDLLQAFFLPNRNIDFPIPTLLDIRSPNPQQGRPILDYFIHFPVGYTWSKRVRTDIKWDAEGERVTEYFLESLLMLILLEATRQGIKDIDLRYTYPKAFSIGEQNVLKGEWTRTLETLTKPGNPDALVGNVANQTVVVSGPAHHSEGKMASVYFSNGSAITDALQRANALRSVCVDVGGGTSDLALLYDGDIVYDSSIRMAGGDIAAYIAARPRLQAALFSDTAQAALAATRHDTKLFGACINGVLRKEKARIPDQLNRQSNNPDVIQLRQLIALKFGALAFHVGTVLGAMEKKGVAPGLAQKMREGGISIHWGGNGGQLATWIDFGNYRPDGLAAQMLNGLLYYALSDAEIVPNGRLLLQVQSPSPKGEAAKGVTVYQGVGDSAGGYDPGFLLADEMGGDGAVPSIDGYICGENVTLTDGTEVGFLKPINLATMFDGNNVRLAKSSGERLRRFISLFNKLGAKFNLITADTRIPDDDATITRSVERALDRYVQMKELKEANRTVEPVFITEVRALIEFVISASQ